MANGGLFDFLERLCEASALYQEPVVSQWTTGDKTHPIVIEPGTDPLTMYGRIRRGE